MENETPGLKDFVVVLIIFLIMTVFSYIAYYRFNLFHQVITKQLLLSAFSAAGNI